MSAGFIRMRRQLVDLPAPPALPPGLAEARPETVRPIDLHDLLLRAYADGGGSVPDFAAWYWPLVRDEEFDPALLLVVVDPAGMPVGLLQGWTSGFIKDIVVAPDHRSKRIGEWLLATAFAIFAARGVEQVDLKVEAANKAGLRFYARHGMVAVTE